MSTNEALQLDGVLEFWFKEIEPKSWWVKDQSFDKMIGERFGALHESASKGELYLWRSSSQGRLAEVIVLDQFSRNMFRDDPKSFAQDPMALALAQEAVALGMDAHLNDKEKSFLYMPYMHSESKIIHAQSLRLFSQPGLEGNIDFAKKHKAIVDRFGRYPHRNKILGRKSSPKEIEFLSGPESSF